MKFRISAIAAALLCCAALAHAQAPLRLQISDGRVTLHAQNVPMRTILAEWARIGGTKIVNGDRVAGAPLTLDLEGVPERQALDIILRSVSGYALGMRAADTQGASMYDRIMILPTSVAPRNPTPAAAAPFQGGPGGIIRPIVPPRQAAEDQDGIEGGEMPQPNPMNDGVPLGRPMPIARPVGGAPFNPPVMPPIAIAPEDQPQPQQPTGIVPTPTNPFGLPAGSSSRPGVVTPLPQQPQSVPQGGARPQE
jgi:hypothetical protein